MRLIRHTLRNLRTFMLEWEQFDQDKRVKGSAYHWLRITSEEGFICTTWICPCKLVRSLKDLQVAGSDTMSGKSQVYRLVMFRWMEGMRRRQWRGRLEELLVHVYWIQASSQVSSLILVSFSHNYYYPSNIIPIDMWSKLSWLSDGFVDGIRLF